MWIIMTLYVIFKANLVKAGAILFEPVQIIPQIYFRSSDAIHCELILCPPPVIERPDFAFSRTSLCKKWVFPLGKNRK